MRITRNLGTDHPQHSSPNTLDLLRRRYNRFFVDHEIAWELIMAALSIAFVVVGFLAETATGA